MSRSGGESNQLHSKHLCHCWFVWSLCNHTNQSTQSKPEVLGDCAGGAGTGPVNLTFLVCVSCHSDLIVTRVKDHWCQRSLMSNPSVLRDVVPDPPLLMPWPFPNLLVPLIQQWQVLDPTPGRSALTGITTNNRGRMKH